MTRKTPYGRYIISAGEIGAYTVCPEAWRLKNVTRVRTVDQTRIEQGKKLHRQWANTYDEAIYLSRHIKLVVLLVLLTLLFYLLTP